MIKNTSSKVLTFVIIYFSSKSYLCEYSDIKEWHHKRFKKLSYTEKKEVIDWLNLHVTNLSCKQSEDDAGFFMKESLIKNLSENSKSCLNKLFLKILLTNLDYTKFQKNYGNLSSVNSIKESSQKTLDFYTYCLKLCNTQ